MRSCSINRLWWIEKRRKVNRVRTALGLLMNQSRAWQTPRPAAVRVGAKTRAHLGNIVLFAATVLLSDWLRRVTPCKINTAVTFCYLWFFLTCKCVYKTNIFIHLVTQSPPLCFHFLFQVAQYISRSHVIYIEDLFLYWQPYFFAVRVLPWFIRGNFPLQNNLVYSLAHIHISRPYCI